MKNRAFTISELIVIVWICSILLGALLIALVQARSTFQATDILVELQRGSRLATRRILSDLRRVTTPYKNPAYGIIITQNSPFAGSDTITYHLPNFEGATGDVSWESAMRIRLDPNGTGNLIKEVSATSEIVVLAKNVTAVNFMDHTIDPVLYLNELRINLILEKSDSKGITHSVSSNSTVDMRN